MARASGNSRRLIVSTALVLSTIFLSPRGIADQYRSSATGSWSAIGTWQKSSDGGGTWPAAATTPGNLASDTVLIRNGHTVTINTNFTIGMLTVGEGTSGVLAYDGTGRTTSVTGDITVAAGGTFRSPSSGPGVVHTLSIGGDITNGGTITFSSGARFVNLTFNKNGNQTVSGSGTTSLNAVTLNMGTSKANVLDMQAVFSMGGSSLTVTNGTFKLSSASSVAPFGGNVTLGSTAGFYMNNASAVSTWGAGGSLVVNGDLTIASGTMTVGAGANRLEIGSTGTFTQSGGTLNVLGRLQANTAGGSFAMSGGTFNIPAGGAVNAAANSIFEITGATFSMTNGTVSIASPNANTTLPDVNINRSGTPISGGTFVITTGASASIITVSSNVPFYNFTVQNAAGAVTARLRANTLKVANNLTISSGTLDAATNAINVEIGGNWSNAGTFLPGTNTVTLNGTSTQSMSGSTFNNLMVNNAAGVTLLTNETVSNTLTLSSGIVTTGADTMIIGSGGSVSRTGGHIAGNLKKIFATGAQAFTFDIGDGLDYTPAALTFANVTGAGDVTASTNGSEHPSISSSGIDASKSVNRYWSLAAGGGITFSTYDVTFTFVNPGDLDGSADTGAFVVRRYSGGSWFPTTTGIRASASTQATGMTAMSDFAIGEQEIDHYDVSTSTPQTAGVAFSASVTAKDLLNETVAGDNSTVVTMSGTGSVEFDSDGNGTFGDNTKTLIAGSFSISSKDTTAETINIAATDGNAKTGTQAGVLINPAVASKLTFVQQPTAAAAGVAVSPAVTVQLKDAFGNDVPSSGISVDVTLSSGTGTLSGTTTQVTNGSGLATFGGLSIDLTGSKNLTAASTGLASAVSAAFTVSPASATHLVFVQEPTTTTAGVAVSPAVTVQLKDAFENNVPGSGVLIAMTLSTGTGTLSGTATKPTDSSGRATFGDLSVNLTGSKNLTAASTGLTSAVSSAFTITSAAATHLVIVQEPTNATAGVAISPSVTVQLKDAFENDVPSSGVSIVMALSTGTGTLSGTASEPTDGAGLATFGDLSVNLTGPKNLTASSTGLDSAVSSAFTITAAAATHLAFVQEPTDATAGVAIVPAVTVQLKDAFENNVPSSGVSVDMTLSTGTGSLSGTATQPTDASGVATFADLSVNLSGSKNLTAASTGLISGVSTAFTITSAAATHLVFLQEPTNATAGVAVSPAVSVQLKDAFENNVLSSGVSIDMTLSAGTGALGGTATQPTDASGVATFGDLSINLVGSKNLKASSAGLDSTVSSAFTISAAEASQLAFVQQPTDAMAGVVIAPAVTVQLRDSFGNDAPSAGVSVALSLSSGTGTLSGTAAQVTDTSGLASFGDLSIQLAGSKNLTAASSGLTPAISAAFTISPATGSGKLVFVQSPSTSTAGVAITPAVTVQLQDTFGNDVTTSGVSVLMSLSSGTGTLSGTATRNTNASGLVTFNDLSINLSGSKNLTAAGTGLTPAVSAAFTINPAAASQVAFTQQPSSATAGVNIAPGVTVQLKDAFGNNVSSSGVSVQMVLSSGTGTLSGTVTQPTGGSGLATFGDLSVNLAGSKNLTASSTGLASAVSAAFTISPAAAHSLAFVQQPSNTGSGVAIAPPVTVQLLDAFGNQVSSAGVTVTMSLSSGTGTLNGTTMQATDGSGLAAFSTLRLDLTGVKALTASGTELVSAVSDPFTISEAVFAMVESGDWNLISLPLLVENPAKEALFPSSTASTFTYAGSYQERDTLRNGVGYWLKFGAAETAAVSGATLTALADTVKTGWNMIGAITKPVAIADVVESPSGIVVSNYFGFDSAYHPADSLKPGRGYWVRVNQPGVITLSSSVTAAVAAKAARESLDGLNALTFTDARGRSQKLYFGISPEPGGDPAFFEMPPLPPSGAFDVRFGSQRMAAIYAAVRPETEDVDVLLASAVYPVTVSWNVVTPSRSAFLVVNGKRVSLEADGSTRMASAPSQLLLRMLGSAELPAEFVVEQNYPNPFNPQTSVRFGVPEDARVTLHVYSVLGEEVLNPLNGEVLEAGYHLVNIDGSSLASGVYFYRLEALSLREGTQSFVQIRKMVLAK